MPAPSFASSSSVVASNSTAPLVVPSPGGVIAGSFLVAFTGLHNARILGDTGRIGPPVGWTLLGRLSIQFNAAQALPDHQLDYRIFYRFIPAGTEGSEPGSYIFTPGNFDLIGNPSSNPLNPAGLVVVIVRYIDVDPADPIHNFSLVRPGIFGPSITDVSATTYPPVSSINNARLIRFTGLSSLSAMLPSLGMTERYDVQNSGASSLQAITLSSSDDVLSIGIPAARTITWDNPAVWVDACLILRPSSELPDIIEDWTFLPSLGLYPLGVGFIASRFDNFLYVVYYDRNLLNLLALKINRTTGDLVLTQNLGNITIENVPYESLVVMDVGVDGVYIVDDNFVIHKFSLTFVPLATSAAYLTYSLDIVVGSGLSAGKIWNLTEATVRRYDASTLAFIDEVSPALWEPGVNFHAIQGTLDASGNLWVVSESTDMTMSRLSFVSAATMEVVHYDITSTFPGSAFAITFSAEENALFIANTHINEISISRGQVSKWDIALASFTDSFFSEKAFFFTRSGFKFGTNQCILPLSLPANPPFRIFCLPNSVEESEALLLCTGNLSLAARFPTPAINGLGIVEAIFDSSQSPDYIWGLFWDESDFVYKIAYLNLQATIDCCQTFPLPTQTQPPNVFCFPSSIKWRGVDRRVITMPKLR